MPPAALSPAVLMAIGLHAAQADTGDTGDTGTLTPCLSVEEPAGCDRRDKKGLAAAVGLSVLGAAGMRRRRDLIAQLGADGVLPADVLAGLPDAEPGEGAVDGEVGAGDVR